ncbi:putative Tigger transposable element-derived protein 1-like 226 [Homarus americanus]|uniref:Putative Tigger transposable element-derived protein 1-like 226 n=1 Tax=Homarus americanus TaxID=6706 RepID=A0A8J5NDS2_HOMAM|nr:putative Tigger transposable element-derived protein 1-like 226 [Homarus americanus]
MEWGGRGMEEEEEEDLVNFLSFLGQFYVKAGQLHNTTQPNCPAWPVLGFDELESEDIEDVLASHTKELTNEDLQQLTEHSPVEDDDKEEHQRTLTSNRMAESLNMFQQAKQILIDDDPNRKRINDEHTQAKLLATESKPGDILTFQKVYDVAVAVDCVQNNVAYECPQPLILCKA